MLDFGKNKELLAQIADLNTKLENQESFFQAISRAVAIIEFTPEGSIISANENFLNTMGYQLSEIQNKQHSIFCRPEYVNSSDYRTFWQALSQGQIITGRVERIHKNAQTIWLEASYTPVFDHSAKLIKVVKIATDISKQVLQEQSHESMLNAIDRSMAVIEFNLQSEIVNANQNFLNTTHYSLQEILGKKHRIFCEESLVSSPEYTNFWRDLNKGQFKSGKYKRLDKNGQVIWLEASYNPVFDASGNLSKVIKVATNITERIVKADRARSVAAETSGHADIATQKSMEIVQDTVSLMESLSQDILKASQSLQDLNTQADQINNIVGTISGIAEQTNLLALNAAIEAARAGEQGRGFAVVADEVRKLAGRTSSSTTEIAEVISKNIALSNQANDSMEKSTTQIESGSKLVERLNTTISDINAGVKAIGETIEQLS